MCQLPTKLTLDLVLSSQWPHWFPGLFPPFWQRRSLSCIRCSLRFPGSAYRWHGVNAAVYSGALSIPVFTVFVKLEMAKTNTLCWWLNRCVSYQQPSRAGLLLARWTLLISQLCTTSRRFLTAGDGSRLFWCLYVYQGNCLSSRLSDLENNAKMPKQSKIFIKRPHPSQSSSPCLWGIYVHIQSGRRNRR